MATNEWIQLADELFDAFADISLPVQVTMFSQGIFDATKGGYAVVENVVNTDLFWRKPSRLKFVDTNDYTEGDKMARVRGSSFGTTPPREGDHLLAYGVQYKIKTVFIDKTGLGAYYDLHIG